ncbi:hypothetical protein OOC_11056 [Providencia rettgeri Dmel1]|nr:hypothetical protein OOC_11056 [Providencia rettgeri Dmel1]
MLTCLNNPVLRDVKTSLLGWFFCFYTLSLRYLFSLALFIKKVHKTSLKMHTLPLHICHFVRRIHTYENM